MNLVYIENNRPVTDSLTVAETFGKEHRRVLQDIRELGCSEEFRMHHFVHTPYVHPQNGQTYEKCLMTEQGFAFLAFGYTGARAAEFKEMYINEFTRMRDELRYGLSKPSYMIDDPINRATKWIEEERQRQALEALNKQREEQLALQAPKVALYDTVMNAGNNKAMGTVSKMVGYGRNKLFDFLREQKVLRQNNEPYQTYIDRGYFDVRLYPVPHTNGEIENKTQTLVTPKGIDYIHKLLVKHGKIAEKGETA